MQPTLDRALADDPFDVDPPWWSCPRWRYSIECAAHPPELLGAAEAELKRLFPLGVVRRLLARLPAGDHPFLHGFRFVPVDPRLLEIGLALSQLPEPAGLRARLRGSEFETAYLELVAGLLLKAAGAHVRPAEGRGPKGLRGEWIGRWEDGFELVVEAKRPMKLERATRHQAIAVMIHRAACERLGRGPVVHFVPNESRLDQLAGLEGWDRWSTPAAAEAYATTFVLEAERARTSGATGRVDLRGHGVVIIGADVDGHGLSVAGYHGVPGWNAMKPGGKLKEAGAQISASRLPGLVVLDATWHQPPVGWSQGILDALSAPECATVAAVLVHAHCNDEHRFWWIEGPAAGQLGDRLDAAFHPAGGHLLFDPWTPAPGMTPLAGADPGGRSIRRPPRGVPGPSVE